MYKGLSPSEYEFVSPSVILLSRVSKMMSFYSIHMFS